jgi:NADH dehydrogenase (ubiquinone) Fe-S protein 3
MILNYVCKYKKNIFNKNIIIYNNIIILILVLKKYFKEIILLNNELFIILKNNNDLLFILTFLKNHYKFQFKQLVDICTVDYYLNIKFNRFEINYILLSPKYKTRIRLKLYCNEKMLIPSIISLYSSAN